MHHSITLKRLVSACKLRMTNYKANPGFCVKCGQTHNNCEPDAREYECKRCKTPTVFAAEELLNEHV